MICHVVEVNSDCWLILKLYAFHPYLDVFFNFQGTFNFCADLIYAIFLLNLVALSKNNLIETLGSLFRPLYILFGL